jgi:hypothetical protein
MNKFNKLYESVINEKKKQIRKNIIDKSEDIIAKYIKQHMDEYDEYMDDEGSGFHEQYPGFIESIPEIRKLKLTNDEISYLTDIESASEGGVDHDDINDEYELV